MRRMVSLCLIPAALGLAQSAQQQLDPYTRQLDRLDAEAKAAFDREMVRDEAARKNGDCPEGRYSRASEECLGQELFLTRANFEKFTAAIRAILALETPGDRHPVQGPTGIPLTREERLKEFDSVEAAWNDYSKAQCSAAYDQWRGGTIAQVEGLYCVLTLMRSRMRELNFIYDAQLRHH